MFRLPPFLLRRRDSRERIPRPSPAALRYALLGVLLGVGAPAGALFLRRILSSVALSEELREYAFFYLYTLLGTCLVFGLFGYFLGRRADRLRRSRDLYQTLSNRDAVTRLLNARAIRSRYRRAAQHAAQFGEPLTVLMVDVDSLKSINDRWGHAFGSAALRHIARILEESKREEDIAGRWGGDEFLVLMPGADAVAASRVAQKVLDGVRKRPVRYGGQEISATVTIGVATRQTAAPDNLFEMADRALMEGKRLGRDQLCVAEGEEVPGVERVAEQPGSDSVN